MGTRCVCVVAPVRPVLGVVNVSDTVPMDFTINIVPTVELFQESRALIAATRVDEPDAVLRDLLLARLQQRGE